MDQRRLERFTLELPARVQVVATGEDGGLVDLTTDDICAGGAFFRTSAPLPAGTQVSINLVLDLERLKKLAGKQAHITVNGTVLRTEERGMAVRFGTSYKIKPLRVVEKKKT